MTTSETTPQEPKKVTVYVRAPEGRHGDRSEDIRTLSFRRIPEISNKEALKEGMAIDGNSFRISVTADDVYKVFGEEETERTLATALNLWQTWLLKSLEEKGYEVEFD